MSTSSKRFHRIIHSSNRRRGAAAAAAVLYRADDIATPRKWFEAYYLTGFSDSDPISTLEDLGSDGVDPTSATTRRPTYLTDQSNGLPAISLDGGDSVIFGSDVNLVGDFTMGMRFKVGDSALGGGMLGIADSADWTHYLSSSTNVWARNGASDAHFTISEFSANTFYTVILVREGTDLSLYVDGSLVDGPAKTVTSLDWNFALPGLWACSAQNYPVKACLMFVVALYSTAFSSVNQSAWHSGYSGVYN